MARSSVVEPAAVNRLVGGSSPPAPASLVTLKVGEALIRQADESDLALIFSSWLKSYRDSPKTQPCPNGAYFQGQHRVIEQILAKPTVRVLCAVNPEDNAQVFGWICAEALGSSTGVHYAFTKSTHRQLGICSALLRALCAEPPLQYSHWTYCAPWITNHIGATFNPYLAVTL